jgi:hypothetical protein
MAGKLGNVTDYQESDIEDDDVRTKLAIMQKTASACQECCEAS